VMELRRYGIRDQARQGLVAPGSAGRAAPRRYGEQRL
jgi:hypothetical protein